MKISEEEILQKLEEFIKSKKRKGFFIKEGIAFDTNTNLMWLRFLPGQSWKKNKPIGNSRYVPWHSAFDEANAFNKQGGYDGYQDWRLPTIEELLTLLVDGKEMTLFQTIFSKGAIYLNGDIFSYGCYIWTSSSKDDDYAWMIDFNEGKIKPCQKMFGGTANMVFLVRDYKIELVN